MGYSPATDYLPWADRFGLLAQVIRCDFNTGDLEGAEKYLCEPVNGVPFWQAAREWLDAYYRDTQARSSGYTLRSQQVLDFVGQQCGAGYVHQRIDLIQVFEWHKGEKWIAVEAYDDKTDRWRQLKKRPFRPKQAEEVEPSAPKPKPKTYDVPESRWFQRCATHGSQRTAGEPTAEDAAWCGVQDGRKCALFAWPFASRPKDPDTYCWVLAENGTLLGEENLKHLVGLSATCCECGVPIAADDKALSNVVNQAHLSCVRDAVDRGVLHEDKRASETPSCKGCGANAQYEVGMRKKVKLCESCCHKHPYRNRKRWVSLTTGEVLDHPPKKEVTVDQW